jgi:hypothetical protein
VFFTSGGAGAGDDASRAAESLRRKFWAPSSTWSAGRCSSAAASRCFSLERIDDEDDDDDDDDAISLRSRREDPRGFDAAAAKI